MGGVGKRCKQAACILVAELFLCCMWLPAIACSSVAWTHGQAGQGSGELQTSPAAGRRLGRPPPRPITNTVKGTNKVP